MFHAKKHEYGISAKRGLVLWLRRFLEIDVWGGGPFARLSVGHRIVLIVKWVLAVICAVYVLMFIISLICICLMYPVGWLALAVAVIFVIKHPYDGRRNPLRRQLYLVRSSGWCDTLRNRRCDDHQNSPGRTFPWGAGIGMQRIHGRGCRQQELRDGGEIPRVKRGHSCSRRLPCIRSR